MLRKEDPSQLYCFYVASGFGGFDCLLVAIRFPCSKSHFSSATFAAYHFLDFLPESLVDQSIHKGVNGRVEQDQCKSNGECDIVCLVGRAVKAQLVDDSGSQPAHCKDDTDHHQHQSNSLPYLYNALRINIMSIGRVCNKT